MTHDLRCAFDVLRKTYGTHVAAAKSLKISPQHYRHLRNSGAEVPPKTAAYIIMQAQVVTEEQTRSSTNESCQATDATPARPPALATALVGDTSATR